MKEKLSKFKSLITDKFTKLSGKHEELAEEIGTFVSWFDQMTAEREAQKRQLKDTAIMLRSRAEVLDSLAEEL